MSEKKFRALRQALFVGAVLNTLGMILTIRYGTIFLTINVLPTIGLMVTAFTGFCPLAYVLEKTTIIAGEMYLYRYIA
ncbi:hypothetical protein KC717_04600 [Candidatus Dojkabacteria bacterium]|uniref:DUF2892 domain-containing protein n=1 Tax=Candidatus Dojkabacteria bacterium TaxID=2099670 RepID=A0A955RKI0_9BACT|nr:hypothetical protein [Candidatus Dojkabacteria bacterium]